MAKGPEAFRSISEAADELGVPQHVLRFWETKFSFIRPMKRAGGRRFYRPQDIAVLAERAPAAARRRLHHQGRPEAAPRTGRQALPRWRSAALAPAGRAIAPPSRRQRPPPISRLTPRASDGRPGPSSKPPKPASTRCWRLAPSSRGGRREARRAVEFDGADQPRTTGQFDFDESETSAAMLSWVFHTFGRYLGPAAAVRLVLLPRRRRVRHRRAATWILLPRLWNLLPGTAAAPSRSTPSSASASRSAPG